MRCGINIHKRTDMQTVWSVTTPLPDVLTNHLGEMVTLCVHEFDTLMKSRVDIGNNRSSKPVERDTTHSKERMVEDRRGGPIESRGAAGRVPRPPEGQEMYLHARCAALHAPEPFPYSAFYPFWPCWFRSQHHPHPQTEKFRPSELKELSKLSPEMKYEYKTHRIAHRLIGKEMHLVPLF